MQEHGFQVDGNMSVEEVLEALALPKTPEMKEHARSIIDRSNEMNTPLFASTVNQLLMHGNITDLHNSDITHLHDESILEQDDKDLNDAMRFQSWLKKMGITVHSIPLTRRLRNQVRSSRSLNYTHYHVV